MQNKLKGGVDFMSDCIDNPPLYGRFLTAFYDTPPPSDQDLSQWFLNEGYDVNSSECEKIRNLMNKTQGTPVLHY